MYPSSEEIKTNSIYTQMGLNNSEYNLIVKHLNGRLPNYTELGIYSVMWSEHCSYKNSKNQLKKFPTTGKNVLQGPGEGAGIIDIGDDLAIVFKIESHNHPSAIEPYQGAATGVGGIIRDIFSMGARPIASLNSLRFGELNTARNKYLFENVVKGISDYGNCVGVPTIGGEIYFDEAYAGNPLVNVMALGILKHFEIQKGVAKGIGNSVMYVGAATGKDGIHGATFASEELSEASESKRPSVQVGDPFLEKLLIEACLEVIHHPKLVGIQDMGAAGLSCSSAEMASKGNVGIEMNLNLIPQREKNMSAYEMMLSESQERMLLVVEKGFEHEIAAIFQKWDLHAVTVGEVISEEVLRLFHNDNIVGEMPVHSLAKDAPVNNRESKIPEYFLKNQCVNYIPNIQHTSIEFLWKKIMAQPTIASKKYVFEQFDYMVQTNTVKHPTQCDASIVRIKNTNKAIALTVDCNSRFVFLNPEVGGKICIAEATRNIVASGAIPIGLTDGLNFGNPENPEIFWQIEKSIDGMVAACHAFTIPVIGGNVSLYNERSNTGAIYPTPIIGMAGLIEDLKFITTQKVKNVADKLFIIGNTKAEFGGSEFQKMMEGKIFGNCPDIDLKKANLLNSSLIKAIREGLINSAHDVSEGGIAVAVAEKLFDTNFGAKINNCSNEDDIAFLFSESQNRFIVSSKFEKELVEIFGDNIFLLGEIIPESKIIFGDNEIDLVELENVWKNSIEKCLKN